MENKLDYRNELNSLKKEFTKENLTYFDDLQLYMSFKRLMADEEFLFRQLYEMACDMLDAQDEHISAEAFFGHKSKEMADALIKNAPRSSWRERIKLIVVIAGVLWAIKLATDFIEVGRVIINPLGYLFQLLLGTIAIIAVFKLMNTSIYAKSKMIRSTTFQVLGSAAIGTMFVGLSIACELYLPKIFLIYVHYPFDIILFSVLVLILIVCIVYQVLNNHLFKK